MLHCLEANLVFKHFTPSIKIRVRKIKEVKNNVVFSPEIICVLENVLSLKDILFFILKKHYMIIKKYDC